MGVDFVAVQVTRGTVLREPCARGGADARAALVYRGYLHSLVRQP